MGAYIDFKQLKATVAIGQVLDFYNLKDAMKGQGVQLVGKCPFHKDEKPSLSVNLQKNAWQCFGCHKKGNVLDFVQEMEELETIHQAGAWIIEHITPGGQTTRKAVSQKPRKEGSGEANPKAEATAENTPLSFALKGLDEKAPYLTDRVQQETIARFGLGLASRGSMSGRVAIPIHNERGELIAYAGRWASDDLPDDQGKYKLPAGFQKSSVLFNLNSQKIPADHLVVVEGFFSVFRLYEAGFENVVALMGSSMSERQEALLLRHLGTTGRVSILLDDDDAGNAGTKDIVERLSKKVFVRTLTGRGGKQADELTAQELQSLVG